MAKISVSHLGKIEEAEFQLAPLNILVGKNNTGKTYLANLIWAVCNTSLANGGKRRGRKQAWLTDAVKPMNGPEKRTVIVTAAEAKKVFAAGKKDLQSKIPSFLSKVFCYDGFSKTEIEIYPDDFQDLHIKLEVDAESYVDKGIEAVFFVSIKYGDIDFTSAGYPLFFLEEFSNHVSDRIYYDVFGIIAYGYMWPVMRNPTYIPAARTGLMLAMKSLVDDALDYSSDDNSELPLPLAQFARRMQRGPVKHKQDITPARQLLLDKMVDGQLVYKRGEGKGYAYRPKGMDAGLPLHAVSSMITELAPLMVDMNSNLLLKHIIFEEPEAHLHLEAQREMARVIVRMVHEGTMVTLTTHSDTFIQQINNLMSIADHPRRDKLLEKFGYTNQDVISKAMVNAFEFCEEGGKTRVRQIINDGEGFVVPTLNKTLLSLAQETFEIRASYE